MLISEHMTPVMYLDPSGYFIGGFGFSFLAGTILGTSLSVWIVFDSNGNIGFLVYGGAGAVSPAASASLSSFFSWRESIDDMNGYSETLGASGDFGGSLGGDLLLDEDGLMGVAANVGGGYSPYTVEGHYFLGESHVVEIGKTDTNKDFIFQLVTAIKKILG